jgi:2-methylisocitrate lyase-like PEP mutase family enzyme
MRATTKLRQILASGRTVVAPGVFDGLSARLTEQAEFPALYASGGAIARSAGIPDLGLLSLSEIVARLEMIVDAVSVPVIADADTGYGNALNVQRAVRAFERTGVAALHLEDQTFPKKCGHYEDKGLVPVGEMAQKLKAARDALSDQDFIIIARTDAIAVEGFAAALDRAAAYGEAGADVIFVEAPTTEEEIAAVARRFPGWKLIGYNIVIIPSDLQRAAIKAMQRALTCIARDGSTAAMTADMASFKEREAVIDTAGYIARDQRYAS